MAGEGLLLRRCDNRKTGLVCVDVGRIARRRPLEATRVRHVRSDSISVPLTVRGSSGFSVERQSTRLKLALTVPKFLGTEPLFLGCRGSATPRAGPCDETAQPLSACLRA